jgi:glucose-1-phosphate cytidylyltransferase
MKVVLFCGGRGIRLRELSEAIPKPMVTIGYRPILWHVMRYYAHFGHRDFILCLGYRADAIKEYFLRYEEALSNDFVLSDGGRQIELLGSDIQDWRITFADTGLDSTIGERLRLVRRHLEGEELFLANYGDTLTDAPLDRIVEEARSSDAVATLLSVRPPYSFHVVRSTPDGLVSSVRDTDTAGVRINGGGYVLRPEIFDYLDTGQDLVDEPFHRLSAEGRVKAVEYDGFWLSLDTLKELQELQRMEQLGVAPWAVWRAATPTGRPAATSADRHSEAQVGADQPLLE